MTDNGQAPLGESLTGSPDKPEKIDRKWLMLAMILAVVACFIALMWNIQQTDILINATANCNLPYSGSLRMA